MFVKKDNLVIRSATIDDAQSLNNWWNDGKVMAHAGFPNGLGQSLEETISQIKENDVKLSQRCIIMIDNIRVGEMNFRIKENYADIGIKICDASFQNRGYGSNLLRMLIEYLFTDESINNEVKIEKIILDTDYENKRAQHVYENIGFKKTRVIKNAWRDQLGEMRTSVCYEISLEDYKNIYD